MTTGLLIIADDLSGAADCAIGFAGAGRRTVVTLDATSAGTSIDTTATVIAADTDTRRLTPAEAGARTAAAWRALQSPGRRLYKKIDSTLRGNWTAEVAALQPLAGLAIVAPAFPATGRTVREGRVLVHGAPLESTETWQLENAGRDAGLAALLQAENLRTEVLSADALRGAPDALREKIAASASNGIQALIVDAETSDDLSALARVTAAMSEPLFWVGSGGLSRELAALPDLFDSETLSVRHVAKSAGAILILVGSLSAVSERQCAMLRERAGVTELIVPPAVLREGADHPAWGEWLGRIGARLQAGADLIVRIGRDEAFDPAEGAHLSTTLAALVAPHFAHLDGLIATGGETARAMLAAVNIGSLELLAEVEAGVAVARPGTALLPAIVTKAGAFGSEHALYGAYLHLRGAAAPERSAAASVAAR
ncbi:MULTISPECIES: four-carbon acid sugar kinase family protein [unclassified Caballeronia]|uniref:four-carbon acid sugar kinase family protein n=1 Tax=unclassified Caballeronia TaxID=2646786 RepID=UPI0028627346|nr:MULTISPECIES: four-carbon acid sugar kinase family protein [unclassified Caballeronia]MDR5753295.1 four-carbon acid sugar kinase family protein [Caballeronia sp. LZ024]MDR5841034.1 four-carbon acid sugar kinase family protein [Caballeronia sp. LZ031]